MDQEKIGKLIKKIRKDNNLSQKEFAKKYNVTYQAVSKWENAQNLPDLAILQEICNDYNIDINNLLGNKRNNKKKLLYVIGILLVIIVIIFIIIYIKNKNDFSFKTLSTTCNNYTITGSIAYNKKKSSIYISNIDYCGTNEDTIYKKISCTLYEEDKDIINKIDTYEEENISIKEFLKNVSFKIDNYEQVCKTYTEDSFYIELKETSGTNQVIVESIPLKLEDC